MTWLVAGLGNPGDRYARTRHNAGAMVVESLAADAGERFRKARFIPIETAEIRVQTEGEPGRVVLARSLQFMNVAGPSIASLAKRLKVGVDRVVACHDEIDLPFGALRVKRGGSTAGHHGLDSLVQGFRSPDFFRVRLGVGRPPGRVETHPDWLLEPFARRELPDVEILVADGADAARSLIVEGLAATQERFNRGGVGR
jgi:PTH1 family peptidyl-tRNA hydrolase